MNVIDSSKTHTYHVGYYLYTNEYPYRVLVVSDVYPYDEALRLVNDSVGNAFIVRKTVSETRTRL